MILDVAPQELLLLGVVALLVIPPKDLPKAMRLAGQWIGRARGMARQFREQLEEEITLDDARKAQAQQAKSASQAQPSPPPPVPPATQVPPEANASTAAEATSTSEHASPPHAPTTPTPRATDEPPAYSAEPEPHNFYPPHYSHAHPTDEQGREIPAPDAAVGGTVPHAHEPAPQMTALPDTGQQPDPRQEDWIGGSATPAEKPAANATDAAYAPPHGRGT